MPRNKVSDFLFPILIGDEQTEVQTEFLASRKPLPAGKCKRDTFGRPYIASIHPDIQKSAAPRGIPIISAILRTAKGIKRIGDYDPTRTR